MRASVRLRLPEGDPVTLAHGDVIGRMWNSALVIDDPRVSEAHAMVSQRGHELKLLGLRGRFAVDGRPAAEVTLRVGQEIELADGLILVVDEVEVPPFVLGLTTDGMPPRALPGTCALLVSPAPALAPPSHPDAVGHVWAVPQGWHIRAVGGVTQLLEAGSAVEIGGRAWRAVQIAVEGAAFVTRADNTMELPLRIVTRYDTVHVFRPGLPPTTIQGLGARLLSELVLCGGPVGWSALCAELWPEGGSRKQLDMVLVRLRHRLRADRIRSDLVRADGTGLIELLLRPDDVVEDQA